MKQPLWVPSEERRRNANITYFITHLNEKYGLNITNYRELHAWSVENIPEFWATMWDYAGIRAARAYDQVVDDLNKFPGARWFVGAKLNFAENLLRYRDDQVAVLFRNEAGERRTLTYAELYDRVARLAAFLREVGVQPGNRVVGYMPNIPETVIAMLAATSLGATWASCATDLGATAALDRLGQLEPVVMVTADGYTYKGKPFDTRGKAAEVANNIPSLRKVIVVGYAQERPDISDTPNAILWDDALPEGETPALEFVQVPANHPLYIMFSSGTTGKPKAMVQSIVGVLINHLKELILHTDLRRDDRIVYITTPSWMMWNWLVSSLGVGATVVLWDGNPSYPDWRTMWRVIEEEGITVFGTSATYIHYLMKQGAAPGTEFNLASLKEISQTGSVLSPEGFEYVYKAIKEDLHLNSISGGTDINGCFAAGNPISPVYKSEIQGPALAMKVKAYDEQGNEVWDQLGELVCEAPSPSMPIYFWNDPHNEKYLNAYFRYYTHKRVWRHGDYIVMHSDTGGITFYGRSDATLKPSGVRIGTAEIYNIVEQLPEVADSLAVGQWWQGDQRVILFVKLKEGYALTEELRQKIRRELREKGSPRHVPALILEAPDIPYTFSMKKVEIAVSNILNGRPVTNRDALINPESLDYFEKVAAELRAEA